MASRKTATKAQLRELVNAMQAQLAAISREREAEEAAREGE